MTDPTFTLYLVAIDWERFREVVDLRYTVLHEPFGVMRDDDWNDSDPASQHFVALSGNNDAIECGGEVIGYARLIWDGASAQIRQVAVAFDHQRSGVGSALIETLVSEALEQGAREIWLNSRESAVAFYERLGFVVTSGPFTTGRTVLPHRRMEYRG